MEIEKRITELEIRYTHQEAFAKQLSDALFEQQRIIERLELRQKELERRLSDGGSSGPSFPNEPPPHY